MGGSAQVIGFGRRDRDQGAALHGRRHRAVRYLSLALAAVSVSGCSGVAVLNAVEPKGGLQIVHDIAYRPGARGALDVYRPLSADGRAPVVVFVYGGGWDAGAKADYAFVGAALASKGYVTVIPDYRVYPQVVWPDFLRDNALAVRWARDHAAEYGGDPARLVLMGHSAGAYNVAMLGADRRWLAAVGLDPARDVRAVIGLAGPYDFLPLHSDELKIIFGPADQRPATQPIAYVDGREPPMFLAADVGDTVVEPSNTTRMAARIRARGGQVEDVYYPHLDHALLVGALAAPLRFLAPVLRDASRFIDVHARGDLAPAPVARAQAR